MSRRRDHRDPVQDRVLESQMSNLNLDRFIALAKRVLVDRCPVATGCCSPISDFELLNRLLEGQTLKGMGVCDNCLDLLETQYMRVAFKMRGVFDQADGLPPMPPEAVSEILHALEHSAAQAPTSLVICEFHGYSVRRGLDPCEVCPCELPDRGWIVGKGKPVGRPRRYCSNSCRQRAHRLRGNDLLS